MTALLSSPHDFMGFHIRPASPRGGVRSSTPPSRPPSTLLSSPARSTSSLATFVPTSNTSAMSTANTSDDDMQEDDTPDKALATSHVKPRPRLLLTQEQKADFVSHIEDSKKKFISDTAHLPKTTNMGLSNADAAAALSQNRFNYPKHEFSWDVDEEDDISTRRKKAAAKDTTVFQMALPVLYVSNIANTVLFWQKVLGFSPVGKPATHQAVMRRGPVSSLPRTSARAWSAVPPYGQDPGVRIVLRLRPQEWGEMSGDGMGPPQLMVAVNSVDELYTEVTKKLDAIRPKGDEYFPEVWFFKAKVLSKPQNKPWGARELHMLDPDGNKIVFFAELQR